MSLSSRKTPLYCSSSFDCDCSREPNTAIRFCNSKVLGA